MTIKDKLKSYNFWITLVSAIILLLQVFGEKFNFKIDSNFIIDVTTALCSIFVVLGIISVPKSKTTKTDIRFVEPNYQELSEQISKELSQRIDMIFNNNNQIQEPNLDKKLEPDHENIENTVSENETTENNKEQISSTNSESEMTSENEIKNETENSNSEMTSENEIKNETENSNVDINFSISGLNDDINI